MRWTDRERKSNPNTVEIPTYLMGGPVHDAIGAIHDIAEESRKATLLLKELELALGALSHGQNLTHQLLQAILRDQAMNPGSGLSSPAQSPQRHSR